MVMPQAGRLSRLEGSPRGTRSGTVRQRLWRARWQYVFVLPSLVLASMFTFYPSVASWYLALLEWRGFGTPQLFVGMSNFTEVVGDSFFWDAFGRSFLFMVVAVPIKLALGLVIALVLNNQAMKLAPVFRTMFFMPVVTTAAIVGVVMTFILSPANGPINQVLTRLGIVDAPVDFLGDPDTSLGTVIGVFVWKSVGMTMIYWLAALQVVPKELYEAARVDGARTWMMHTRITVPLITPFALIITLVSAIQALNIFALVETMTGGGPYFASEIMEVFIYRTAFGTEGTTSRLGYASAAGVFFGIAVMFVAVLQGLAVRRANAIRGQLNRGGAA